MAAGADMASVSMHKSGGSLTQSSLLLIGPNVHPGYVRQIINLTQTTDVYKRQAGSLVQRDEGQLHIRGNGSEIDFTRLFSAVQNLSLIHISAW